MPRFTAFFVKIQCILSSPVPRLQPVYFCLFFLALTIVYCDSTSYYFLLQYILAIYRSVTEVVGKADQMTGCYLTTFLRAIMRGIADFDPQWASSYFLPRDTVHQPSLSQRVWPGLDRWQAAHLERLDVTEQVQPNLAAGGFLELLQRFHSVFLQVSTTYLCYISC